MGYAAFMYISSRKLIGLPVVTRSRQPVGKVAEIEIDTDTGRLQTLIVHTRKFLLGLLHPNLRVAWNQVISITDQEVVIVDGAVPIEAVGIAMGVVPPTMPGNATER